MIKLKNSTLGFSDTKTPMQKARVEDTLNKLWKYTDGVMTEKDFSLTKLLSGYNLEKVENYQEYKRDGELSKPKTIYKLYSQKESHWNLISKTAYDFLIYVQENNFNDETVIDDYMETEKAEKERLEKQRLQMEQEEKDREEQLKLKEEDERKKVYAEKVKKWNENSNRLLTDDQKREIRNVIQNVFKQFAPDNDDIEVNRYIDQSDYITSIGNEGFTTHNANYTFFEVDSENLKYNMVRSIEKAIYIHLFNIKETDTKLIIKDKLKAFYTQTEVKKRYYQGAI